MIATGTALAIAGAASAAGGAYAAHRAGSTNDKALKAQREDSVQDAALRREELAETRRQYDAKTAADATRWSDYVRVHEPMWRAGAGLMSRLSQIAGMGRGTPMVMPNPNSPPPAGVASGAPPTGAPPLTAIAAMGRTARPTGGPVVNVKPPTTVSPMDLLSLAQMASGDGGARTSAPLYAEGMR